MSTLAGHDGCVSISAAHSNAFYSEVLDHGEVWTVRDGAGFPAPVSDRARVMPFWSLSTRAQRVVDTVEAYHGFDVVALPLTEWRSRWLPGLQRDGVLVGLNWSGERATGYDLAAQEVAENLNAREGG
jgi:hypothetical protein